MGRSAPERSDPLRKSLQKIKKLETRQAALADRHNELEEELHRLNVRIKQQTAVIQHLLAAIAATATPQASSYVSLTPQPEPQQTQPVPRIVFRPSDALPADIVHSCQGSGPNPATAITAAAATTTTTATTETAETILDKLPVRVLRRICELLSDTDLRSLAQASTTLAVAVEQHQQTRYQQAQQQQQQQQTMPTGTPARAETPTLVAQVTPRRSGLLRFLSARRRRNSLPQLPPKQQQ